ncbi:DUF488 family protein [Frateuria edaphi]|uniref:DUF488 domain-containing protein n=1 Tax=Frateuria edaphi TaxID=2898793 RepID=UPI003CE45C4F
MTGIGCRQMGSTLFRLSWASCEDTETRDNLMTSMGSHVGADICANPNGRGPTVYTVGHSNHSLQYFLNLLEGSGVSAIADVRSYPYSRHNPQFNKESLRAALFRNRISYAFLGKELGARSEDPSCYEHGRVQYTRLAGTRLFLSGIERVLSGAAKYRIALMCAEKEPLDCHRTLLVSRALSGRGADVRHILPNGEVETHDETILRMLDVVGLPRVDMFRSAQELINEAYVLREKKIAYIDPAAIQHDDECEQ